MKVSNIVGIAGLLGFAGLVLLGAWAAGAEWELAARAFHAGVRFAKGL